MIRDCSIKLMSRIEGGNQIIPFLDGIPEISDPFRSYGTEIGINNDGDTSVHVVTEPEEIKKIVALPGNSFGGGYVFFLDPRRN